MRKAYVSGPMRGYPRFNFDAFDAVRDYLESLGVHVFSPADNDRVVWPECERAKGFAEGVTGLDNEAPAAYSFRSLLVWDIWAIGQSDAIVLLPGWEDSTGVAIELAAARALGLEVGYAHIEGTHIFIERERVVHA